MTTVDTLAFVPVFNQERELPLVLEEIARCDLPGVKFLLIDNGSTDGSSGLILSSRLASVRLETNQGVGGAYRIAIKDAQRSGIPILTGLAANGKMLPSELPRLLDPIRSNEADYVTGSRFLRGGDYPNLPLFRRTAIPLVSVVASLATGYRLTDATNGFRAYRLGLLDAEHPRLIEPWLDAYGFEYYVYAKALLSPAIRCLEVPTTMRYPADGPYSKIRPGKDWLAMIKPWIVARVDKHQIWRKEYQ